ncbi:hypothetical protein NL676_005424 [Syzygium grande]|nr:hypothetical protein NL676_005424 [Syzygium grande]
MGRRAPPKSRGGCAASPWPPIDPAGDVDRHLAQFESDGNGTKAVDMTGPGDTTVQGSGRTGGGNKGGGYGGRGRGRGRGYGGRSSLSSEELRNDTQKQQPRLVKAASAASALGSRSR